MVRVQQKHHRSKRKQLHLLDAISCRDMQLQMSPEERAASSPARTRSNKVRRKCVAVTQTKHVPNGSVFVTSPKLTLSQGTAPERRRCRDGARLHYQNATTAQWRRLDYRHCDRSCEMTGFCTKRGRSNRSKKVRIANSASTQTQTRRRRTTQHYMYRQPI